MPQLTVHNAEIKTATVEIKSLTVSGKQVTLAVFRQLIEAELVDYDGNFAGLPWGTVNYHPGKCDDKTHRHVVWQQGDELRRCRLDRPRWYAERFWCDGAGEWFVQTAFCANGHKRPDWLSQHYDRWSSKYEARFDAFGLSCEGAYPITHEDVSKCSGDEYDMALAEFKMEVTTENERRDQHSARWKEVCDLPQLFIAV
jgi:hypothetical protein